VSYFSAASIEVDDFQYLSDRKNSDTDDNFGGAGAGCTPDTKSLYM